MTTEPQIAIIVAMDINHAIGIKGDMPWRLSADLKRFKQITMGHPVVMGRKTFESLPGGPLPGRRNIVVSRNKSYNPDGAIVVDSPDKAISLCSNDPKIFIIGGGVLYNYFINKADILYLTIIDHDFEADTWFPEFNEDDFETIDKQEVSDDEKFPFSYTFVSLKRK